MLSQKNNACDTWRRLAPGSKLTRKKCANTCLSGVKTTLLKLLHGPEKIEPNVGHRNWTGYIIDNWRKPEDPDQIGAKFATQISASVLITATREVFFVDGYATTAIAPLDTSKTTLIICGN